MIYLFFASCESNYNSQHAVAHTLLRNALFELGYKEIQIKYDENKRPYTDVKDLDFSISHSTNAVLVGIIDSQNKAINNSIVIPAEGTQIGVDIEEIDLCADLCKKNRLAKRFLKEEARSIEEFYSMWTENEAYGKMTGEGVLCEKKGEYQILTMKTELEEKLYSFSICYC